MNQITVVINAMTECFVDAEDLEICLLALDRFDGFGHGTLKNQIVRIAKKARAEGWLPDLAVAIIEARPQRPDIRDLLQSIANSGDAPPASGDFYGATSIEPNRVFIDRTTLRNHVKSIVEGPARVLIVNGAQGSGRSYTVYYLNHVMSKLQWLSVPLCLANDFKEEITVATLAERILLLAGASTDGFPENVAEDSKRLHHVVAWCVGKLLAQEQEITIVIDSFDKVRLSQPAQDFVLALAQRVGQTSSRLRMILLAFDPVPPVAELALIDSVGPIGTDDVRSFFREHALQRGMTFTEEKLERVVQAVVETVPTRNSAPGYLESLGASVWKMCLLLDGI